MDWLDPQLWKKPAELLGYWQTIVVGGGAVVGVLWGFLIWGLAPLRRLVSKLWSRKKAPVERPLRFVLDDHQSLWSPAKSGDQHGTQVHGHWHVTNISDLNVVLLHARLEGHEAKFSHVLALRGDNRRAFARRSPIPANTMSEVAADFTYFPAICSGREPLIADVIFTDNYEEEHRVRSVRFPYRGP